MDGEQTFLSLLVVTKEEFVKTAYDLRARLKNRRIEQNQGAFTEAHTTGKKWPTLVWKYLVLLFTFQYVDELACFTTTQVSQVSAVH